jgi:hypothetical protein
MGGYGLYSFEGWKPDGKLPRFETPTLTFSGLNKSPTPLTWISLSDQQLNNVRNVELSNTVATDDIPGTSRYPRKKFLALIRSRKIQWEKTIPIRPTSRDATYADALAKNFLSRIDFQNPWTTSRHLSVLPGYPEIRQFMREYRNVAKVEEIPSLATYLEQAYPTFYSKMKALENQGWHRTDAINLTLGEIPTENNISQNSNLTNHYRRVLSNLGVQYWHGRTAIAQRLSSITALCNHPLSISLAGRLFAF